MWIKCSERSGAIVINQYEEYVLNDCGILIRELIDVSLGNASIYAKNETWRDVFCGNVEFDISNNTSIILFFDVGDLDYIDSFRVRANDKWIKYEHIPEMVSSFLFLPDSLRDKFEEIVKNANKLENY